MSAPSNRISEFLSRYHLWSFIVFLCLLGACDIASLAVWSGYRLLNEIDEARFTYQTHHLENQRRYDQAVGRPNPEPHGKNNGD